MNAGADRLVQLHIFPEAVRAIFQAAGASVPLVDCVSDNVADSNRLLQIERFARIDWRTEQTRNSHILKD